MNNNVFEKIDKQSEQIAGLVEGQAQILELLREQNAEEVRSASATIEAQVQQTNDKLLVHKFFCSTQKTYHYFGDEANYDTEKKKTFALLLLTIIIALVANITTSISIGIFSTFSFVEDLWFFLVFRLICHILHSKRFYDHTDYSLHSYKTFAINQERLFYPTETKRSYRIIKILALISAPCNVIYLGMNYKGATTVIAIIFEVLVFAAIFYSFFLAEDFFGQYTIIYYSGETQKNGTITFVFDQMGRKWYTKEEYEKTFPFAK